MLVYVLDLFGVAVFAASGGLAGLSANFDLLCAKVLLILRQGLPR